MWKQNYLPFGKQRVGIPDNTSTNATRNQAFGGKSYDGLTGLSYFGARYYDPVIGRFMAVDPVGPDPEGNIHSLNRYTYANNNPYKFVDPDGRLPILIPLAIFVAKELTVEGVSYATGGASDIVTDYVSVRRLGAKFGKKALSMAVSEGIKDLPNVAKGAISVDDALGKAADFMKDGVPIRSIDGKTGVQFIQEFSENGQKITKRVGIDVNPNNSHVKQLGPHLNLQTQINGKIQKTGSLADPHIPIDSKTIRSGDY